MFSILRAVIVIGTIFYFSPVRQGSEGVSLDGLFGAAQAEAGKIAPAANAERLESLWRILPESAKQAVVDKIIAPPAARTAETRSAQQTDTLEPEDHLPTWRGAVKKPGAPGA